MKNSSLTKILFITSVIPLIIVLIALQFLPEKIPAHYDLYMNIDRWGSKYESLLFPAFTILMAAFMYGMSRFSAKHENGESNQKVLLISGIAENLFFTVMTIWFLLTTFKAVENLKIGSKISINIIFISAGIVMTVIGNFMPKCKLNSAVGLRTKWSMANEDVWFKCQRFGGVLFVVCGISMAVISAAIKNITLLLAANLFISIVIVAGSAAGSKIIYDRLNNKIQ
ncbi:MAG: SdpI family protein [Oscillospiraceae bacterium]|nr:SdpI family protein [Oscillospiraceae bacterium]